MPSVAKDPNAQLDYGFTWGAWLAGDTISTAEWTVPGGLTKEDESVDGDRTVVWLSGGAVGQTYAVTCRVTTAGGRVDDRTLSVRVHER